jgi:predicted DNA-binding protein (UPF0278 family)
MACHDIVMKNRKQNLEEILQQRQIFHDQVKQMRVKINSHLDTLEQNILKELDDADIVNQCRCFRCFNNFTNRQKTYTIFVVCRNAIWTAWLVMDLTKNCAFHIMIFTVMTDLSEIRQQRQIFHDQVKQMRVKINSHLDTLEHNILKELDDAEDKSINVDVFDVLIISRIDKSPTQSLWFVEIQSGQHGMSWI